MKGIFDKITRNTSFLVGIFGVIFSLTLLLTILYKNSFLVDNSFAISIITGIFASLTCNVAFISLRAVLRKKKIFISYPQADRDFVSKLYKELQAESDATSHGKYRFLLDEDVVSLGDNISQKITLTINDSDAFIIVFSSASLQSEHMKKELEQILKQHKKTIPVLLDTKANMITMPEKLAGIKYLLINDVKDMEIKSVAKKIFNSIST